MCRSVGWTPSISLSPPPKNDVHDVSRAICGTRLCNTEQHEAYEHMHEATKEDWQMAPHFGVDGGSGVPLGPRGGGKNHRVVCGEPEAGGKSLNV